MRYLNANMRVVDQVAFSREGWLFAAGSLVPEFRFKRDNRGVDVWDLAGSAEPIRQFYPDYFVSGFALNPNGRWLYIGVGDVPGQVNGERAGYVAVDLNSGFPHRFGLFTGRSFILDVHVSGTWFVVSGFVDDWRTNRTIRWRQPPDQPPVEEWHIKPRTAHYTRHLVCDPDSTRIITHDIQGGIAVTDQVYELLIRSPSDGKLAGIVPLPGRTVEQLLFSPDGACLVIRGGPSMLVWDAKDLTQKPRKVPISRRGHGTGIAFHPSGRYLAATSNDATVKLYDTSTWEVTRTFTWEIGRMRSIAFSPDGTLAAAGSDKGQVVVWDVDF
jgi:WD40 repeat protein